MAMPGLDRAGCMRLNDVWEVIQQVTNGNPMVLWAPEGAAH